MSKNITIKRAQHGKENPYFIQSRATVQNPKLSYEARGMLSYFLSLPDDWEIRLETLEIESAGRDKVRRIFRELIAAGYVEKRQKRRDSETGQWYYTPYYVHEIPLNPKQDSPHTENPSTGKPSTDEPTTANPSVLHNREVDSTEEQNTQRTEKEKDDDPRARKNALPEKTGTSNAVVSDGQMLLETNWGTFALEDLRLIENDLEHHGLDAVQAAIVTAKDNNASTYRYASKILANGSGKANISAPAREILTVWKDATGTLEANIERHAPTAHNIAAAGYTPDDIQRYVAALKKEDFWKGKAIPLDYIARNIAAWQRTPRGSTSTDGLSSVPMMDDLPDMEPERPPVWKPAEHETENF